MPHRKPIFVVVRKSFITGATNLVAWYDDRDDADGKVRKMMLEQLSDIGSPIENPDEWEFADIEDIYYHDNLKDFALPDIDVCTVYEGE